MEGYLVSRRSFIGGLAAALAVIPFVGWPFRRKLDSEFVISFRDAWRPVYIRLYRDGSMEAEWMESPCVVEEDGRGWKLISGRVDDVACRVRARSPERRTLDIDWFKVVSPADAIDKPLLEIPDGLYMVNDFSSYGGVKTLQGAECASFVRCAG